MSTYNGYYCVKCEEKSPLWYSNASRDRLQEIVKDYYKFKLFQTTEAYKQDYIQLDWLGVYEYPNPLAWLDNHVGHTLCEADEYYRIYFDTLYLIPEKNPYATSSTPQ